MKLRRIHEIDRGRMDITPLIDVVLLLLLFFMLSSSFVIHSGINVRLPESEAAQPYRESKLTVTITPDGRIFMGGAEHSIDALRERMVLTAEDAPDTVVVLNADMDVKHGLVVEVMGVVKKAGLERLAIASKLTKEKEVK